MEEEGPPREAARGDGQEESGSRRAVARADASVVAGSGSERVLKAAMARGRLRGPLL